jgi:adenylate cyclase
MDELFYDKWVLVLLCRYAAFLTWRRTTMARDMLDQPWGMEKALGAVGANCAKWKVYASRRPAARQA